MALTIEAARAVAELSAKHDLVLRNAANLEARRVDAEKRAMPERLRVISVTVLFADGTAEQLDLPQVRDRESAQILELAAALCKENLADLEAQIAALG